MRWTEPHSRSSSSSKSLPRCRREVSVPRLEAGCRTPLPATTPKGSSTNTKRHQTRNATESNESLARPSSMQTHSRVFIRPFRAGPLDKRDKRDKVHPLGSTGAVSPRSLKYTMQTPCHHPSWGGHRSSKNHVVLFPFPLPLPPSSPRLFLSGGAFAACLARCFYRNHAMPCHAMHGLHTTYVQIQYQRADIHPHSIPTIIPSIQTPPPPPPSSPPLPHRHVGQILLRRYRPPSLPHYEYTAR